MWLVLGALALYLLWPSKKTSVPAIPPGFSPGQDQELRALVAIVKSRPEGAPYRHELAQKLAAAGYQDLARELAGIP